MHRNTATLRDRMRARRQAREFDRVHPTSSRAVRDQLSAERARAMIERL
jgi:hypothetical protein